MLSFYKVLSDCFLKGDGKIVLEDDTAPSTNGVHSVENGLPSKRQRTTTHPVDLELEVVLGKMPQKVSCISIYSCTVCKNKKMLCTFSVYTVYVQMY